MGLILYNNWSSGFVTNIRGLCHGLAEWAGDGEASIEVHTSATCGHQCKHLWQGRLRTHWRVRAGTKEEGDSFFPPSHCICFVLLDLFQAHKFLLLSSGKPFSSVAPPPLAQG